MNKSKLLGLMVGLGLFTTAATAQTFMEKPHNQRPFNLGVKGGILVNNLSTRLADYTNDNYIGLKTGIIGRFNIKSFYIQPEILYAGTGGDLRFPENAVYSIRLHTMEFPLLVGFRFLNIAELFSIRINAGPYAAWNFAKSARFNDVNYPENNVYSGDDLRGYSVGVLAGIGFDVWKVGIDVRYQWGLTDLLKERRLFQDPNASIKNGIWEITASYKIF